VMLSRGRVVAESNVADFKGAGTSLEDVFMRVTDQPDYTPVARQIVATIGSV
jgi:hypothetical protein